MSDRFMDGQLYAEARQLRAYLHENKDYALDHRLKLEARVFEHADDLLDYATNYDLRKISHLSRKAARLLEVEALMRERGMM